MTPASESAQWPEWPCLLALRELVNADLLHVVLFVKVVELDVARELHPICSCWSVCMHPQQYAIPEAALWAMQGRPCHPQPTPVSPHPYSVFALHAQPACHKRAPVLLSMLLDLGGTYAWTIRSFPKVYHCTHARLCNSGLPLGKRPSLAI